MLHADDPLRLGLWRGWLRQDHPPDWCGAKSEVGRLQLMLLMALGLRSEKLSALRSWFADIWTHAAVRQELVELLEVLDDRVRRRTWPLGIDGVPLRAHATYSRDEILAAFGAVTRKGKVLGLQQGVHFDAATRTDLLLVTLRKSERDYSPTTLYDDYPMSPTLFHWESQSTTRERSPTGQRYIHHAREGSRVILFVRDARKDDRGETSAYLCLGQVRYLRHQSERPMQVVWQLNRPMPSRFFEQVKVAAG